MGRLLVEVYRLMNSCLNVSFSGTGRALPIESLQSSDLDQRWGTGNRIASTGVRRRFQCREESQVDLATLACQRALRSAGVQIGQIDLIISAASVPYQPIPSLAPLIMRNLGISDGNAPAFDVNSTCLSFLTGLEIAALKIAGGSAQRVLVVSSEVASRALPWEEDPETAALFGDGAAAAVIGASKNESEAQIKAIELRTYPSAYEACEIGAGGTRFDLETDRAAFAEHAKFRMDGKALFRLTSQYFSGFIDALLQEAGWERTDVDLVVPHQASPKALDHMIRQTGFPPEKVVRVVEDYGNQIAASIPFAFDIAREEGRVPVGSKVLFLGTSAGVSFGGAALVT
jgi:3-oxoacyl-[acyl-carrier-protein] synthase-3